MADEQVKEPIRSIIEENRDLESLIVQASATRTHFFRSKFNDRFTPLQFVHLSDVHSVQELWDRMVEFVNHYSDYVSFALHTGDYCGNSQAVYSDCYTNMPTCKRPILNCVGNHDTYKTKFETDLQPKETTHALLFNKTDDWDVQFLDVPHPMSYHKDFLESNVRLIVIDLYYHIKEQKKWLAELLDDAREKGLCVITAMHEPTAHITKTFDVTFHTINDYENLCGRDRTHAFAEDEIARFIANGGTYICNLAGHTHHDLFGLTDSGILNVTVPCATSWPHWCDGKRVRGTRTYDCFNVVSVDTDLGLLKLIRVGDNVDHYLRIKRVLCFDYVNKKVIYNQ